MKPVGVHGLGLWTPGFAGPEAWVAGEADPALAVPRAPMLDGPLRRRASPLTRMAVDALGQALAQAGCDPATTPSVWATAHGEHATAVDLLEMMHRGDGKLSPTRFHNSVHNTPSGYASIATGNRAPSTSVTGGPELVAAALLEALCRIETGDPEVALVLADEPLLPPFDAGGARQPLALAFALSAETTGALAVLSGLRRERLRSPAAREPFGGLYVSAALPLLERIVRRRPGTVGLERVPGSREIACVDVAPVRARAGTQPARPLPRSAAGPAR